MKATMAGRLVLVVAGLLMAGTAAGAQGFGGGQGVGPGFGNRRPPMERAFGAEGRLVGFGGSGTIDGRNGGWRARIWWWPGRGTRIWKSQASHGTGIRRGRRQQRLVEQSQNRGAAEADRRSAQG